MAGTVADAPNRGLTRLFGPLGQCYNRHMEFRVLGPLEVVDDGRPVRLERRLSRALLAFLLLHANELVSSDRLGDQLCAAGAPRTATAPPQTHGPAVRQALGRAAAA